MATSCIETERLVLTPFSEEDAPDMFAWAGDLRQTHLMGWPTHRDVAETGVIIGRFLDHHNEERETFDLPMAMRDKDTRRALGSVGLHLSATFGEDVLELGYIVTRSAQGKGYAHEAARALIQHAFANFAWVEAIVARVHPENARSIRLLLRLGFKQVGTTTCVAPQLSQGPVPVLAFRLDRPG